MKNSWTRYESKRYIKKKEKVTLDYKDEQKTEDLLDFEVTIENGEIDLKNMIVADDVDEMITKLPKPTRNFMTKHRFNEKVYKYNKFRDKDLRVVFIVNEKIHVIILVDIIKHKDMENNRYINHALPSIIKKSIKEWKNIELNLI